MLGWLLGAVLALTILTIVRPAASSAASVAKIVDELMRMFFPKR